MKKLFIICFFLIIVFVILSIFFLISSIVKKNKKYLIGFIGFLSGMILIIVICVISWITTFFGGSFLRYAGPIMGNNGFIVNNYNYKTILAEDPQMKDYNHFNNVIFDNLINIEYGFLKYPRITKAKDADGKLIANEGPPFYFFIDFSDLNIEIIYINLDSIELVNKNNTIDLLSKCNIEYQVYYGENWEMNESPIINQLKKEKRISIINLRKKISEKDRKKKYMTEEEIKISADNAKINFKLELFNIPVNVIDDETIIININLFFTMSDGSIQNKQISDVYYREYFTYNYTSLHSLEDFPYAKDIKKY